MKNKILLSTLLGGALLAACTADDVLDVKEVAGGVNPAAPVFNISFNGEGEDGLTRAEMKSSGLMWQTTDVMSLFHGGGQMNTTTGVAEKISGSDNFLASGAVKNFDAIYRNVATDGGYRFETAAMVNEGLAIMVFPADTAYKQGEVNPHISIDTEQVGGKVGQRTRDKVPFVSEMLNIAKYTGDDTKHEAGYGREYDLVMRRIGGLLQLNLETTGDQAIIDAPASPIKYKEVVMSVKGGNAGEANPFTSDMEIKVGQKRNGKHVKVNATTGKHELVTPDYTNPDATVGTNSDAEKYWEYTPWITVSKKEATISTKDVDNKVAYFTLLPPDEDGKVLGTAQTIQRKDKATGKTITYNEPVFTDPVVTVKTSYGKVTLDKNNGDVWTKKEDNSVYEMTLVQGIAEALTTFFPINKTIGGRYEGQVSGVGGNRYLAVDLSTLDMNGLHVEDETNLIDILNVYEKVIKNNPEITLILDGKKEDNGRFKMTKATWERVSQRMMSSTNKISFALCDKDGEACAAILLDNTDAGTTAAEVPELKFVKTVNAEADDKVKTEISVELKGNWKYTTEGYAANHGDEKELTGVKYLKVLAGAKLELKNKVLAKDNTATNPEDLTIIVEGKTATATAGELNVYSYDTRVGVNVSNNGIINITTPEGASSIAQFRMDNNKTLTNEAGSDVVDGNGYILKGDKVLGGVINNNSWLGSVEQSNAKINNYGTINLSSDARLYISANAAPDTKLYTSTIFKARHSVATDNLIGTIVLADKTAGQANVQVANANLIGFVKLYVKNSATPDDYGTVANYIVLDGGVTSYEDKSGVNYVEVSENNLDEVVFGDAKLQGLMINPGRFINVPKGVTIDVSHAGYIKGQVSKGGVLNIPSYEGYFGGKNGKPGDIDNITSY